MNGDGLSPPTELHAFSDRLFVFERERGHVLLIATVEDLDRFCAQASSCPRSVDGGVARSHDNNVATDFEVITSLIPSDEIESSDDSRMVFTGYAKLVHSAETD